MKAKDIMTKAPTTCTPHTSVAEAAHLMWEADCGMLPVVDGGALVGVVTDRDMYIAIATRNALPSRLAVGAVARTPVVSCAPEDDVHDVLAKMKRAHVRRLPVIGFGNTVIGIVSMNDIVLAVDGKTVAGDEVVQTLKGICSHRHPVPHVVVA